MPDWQFEEEMARWADSEAYIAVSGQVKTAASALDWRLMCEGLRVEGTDRSLPSLLGSLLH